LRLGAEELEKVGIHRAIDRASDADLRIFLAEPGTDLPVKRAAGDIAVAPKADCRTDDVVAVSGKTGLGMRALVDVVTQELAKRVSSAGLISHERHRVAMEKSLVMLAAAVQHVELGPEFYDIAAEEIRASVRSLEAVIGRVDVENLLDEIFSSFCLGK
jgi:tRNA modification GTPase